MPTHNPNNERIKRQYLTFLKEAKRHSESTVDEARSRRSRKTPSTATSVHFGTSRRSPSSGTWPNVRARRPGPN